MGTKIENTGFHSIFISLLSEEWDNIIPVLYTFKTSSEVISFVTMHTKHLSNCVPLSSANPTHALQRTPTKTDAHCVAHKNLVCTNASCGAPGKKGHTIADCFWPDGGKEGQWPGWWKGKWPTAAVANTVEMFAFTAWTVPAAVNVYNVSGFQVVSFGGEEVLASPESLMSWGEVVDAAIPVVLSASIVTTSSLDVYLAPSSTKSSISSSTTESFNTINIASIIPSKFKLIFNKTNSMPNLQSVSNSNSDEKSDPVVPYTEACSLEQIALEAFLQARQPYPGDNHVQSEWWFLVYQISDIRHRAYHHGQYD